ncbi:unnamed protein product [Effrenium voratum]|nr:unnamed protein product [Effrenium voratum]
MLISATVVQTTLTLFQPVPTTQFVCRLSMVQCVKTGSAIAAMAVADILSQICISWMISSILQTMLRDSMGLIAMNAWWMSSSGVASLALWMCFRPRCSECYGSIFARKFPENFRGKISAQKGVASKLSFSMPKASRSAFQMSGTPFSNFILKMAV